MADDVVRSEQMELPRVHVLLKRTVLDRVKHCYKDNAQVAVLCKRSSCLLYQTGCMNYENIKPEGRYDNKPFCAANVEMEAILQQEIYRLRPKVIRVGRWV